MSYITAKQIQIVQIARRQVEKLSNGLFDETSFRTALCNCGVKPDADGRCSTKRLTQAGFEKFMAILEGMGFRQIADGDAEHWRNRNAARTGFATSRQVYEIRRLAPSQKYPLYALCRRVSNDQHNEPEKLTFSQAHQLIEALKAIAQRSTGSDADCLVTR